VDLVRVLNDTVFACGPNFTLFHLFSFELQAITTPSMAVSHIMLESYKKFILVALILQGKIPALPKYTSQVVGRYVKVMENHLCDNGDNDSDMMLKMMMMMTLLVLFT
jgi:hypothetical protein